MRWKRKSWKIADTVLHDILFSEQLCSLKPTAEWVKHRASDRLGHGFRRVRGRTFQGIFYGNGLPGICLVPETFVHSTLTLSSAGAEESTPKDS